MAEIAFGEKGLKGNTPVWVKWIYRACGLATAIWTLIISTYPTIPTDIQIGVMKALGLGTAIIYTVCQFVGYADSPVAENSKP